MSLKTFHIVFVAASILLSLGFGIWAIRQYSSEHGGGMLALAAGGFAGAVGLLAYGVWFLKKLQRMNVG